MRAATTGGADVLTARDQQIVIERDLGDTIVEISRRHGISHQRVSVITRRAREVVTKAYMDLLVASNTGEQCASVIPTDPTTRSRSTSRPGSSRSCGDSGLNLQLESRRAHTRRGWRGVVMTPPASPEIEHLGRRQQQLFDRGGGRR